MLVVVAAAVVVAVATTVLLPLRLQDVVVCLEKPLGPERCFLAYVALYQEEVSLRGKRVFLLSTPWNHQKHVGGGLIFPRAHPTVGIF